MQLIGHDIRLSRFGRMLQGVAVLAVATGLADIRWDPAAIAIAIWAVAGGVALFAGILVLQATLAFWTIDSLEVVNLLTYRGVQAAQNPLNIYASWFRRDWILPLTPLAGFAFLDLSFVAWRAGVARYASTGS